MQDCLLLVLPLLLPMHAGCCVALPIAPGGPTNQPTPGCVWICLPVGSRWRLSAGVSVCHCQQRDCLTDWAG